MKSLLEQAKEAMANVTHPMHIMEDGRLPTPLGEERQRQACMRTAIEASKTLALLSIAESLEKIVHPPMFTISVDYQGLLRKYMAGVIDQESVSFSSNAKDLTKEEETVLDTMAIELGCRTMR